MESSVTFTANAQTGNTTRLSLAIKRLGFKFVNVSFARKPNEPVDLVTFIIESERALAESDFSSVISSIASVTGVAIANGKGAKPAPAPARPAPSRPAPAAQRPAPARPTASKAPAFRTEKITAANLMPQKVFTETEKAAIVKEQGRRLVGLYPAIHGPLMKLESEFAPQLRNELMERIGKAVGHWQYKKNFSKKAALGKTVRGSLDMQKSQFGGMPVISDLIFAGEKKEKELEVGQADPLTQIKLALSDFVDVSVADGTITVNNCPHCSSGRAPSEPDCNFIREFIQGFMVEIDILDGAIATQVTSEATGSDACTFEIRRAV